MEIMDAKAKKSRATKSPRKEVKTRILLDLHALKQERKSRLETTLGRFLECQELQISSALVARTVEQCSRWQARRRLIRKHAEEGLFPKLLSCYMPRTCSGAGEKELQHAKLRLFLVPEGTTFDISARSLLVGGVPGVIRVEVGDRRCQVRCVGAEILLIHDAVLVHDERHHAGVAVFGRVGDERNAAPELAVHQVIAGAALCG